MDDQFKINVEQLHDGHEKVIHESLSPSFLEIDEPELVFKKSVLLDGIACVADTELVVRFDIETEALMACRICNELVPVKIAISSFYHSEPLSEIKTGIYDFKTLLRESILVEIPTFVECHEGKCPHRKEIAKYLKPDSLQSKVAVDGYHPFADLNWEKEKKS